MQGMVCREWYAHSRSQSPVSVQIALRALLTPAQISSVFTFSDAEAVSSGLLLHATRIWSLGPTQQGSPRSAVASALSRADARFAQEARAAAFSRGQENFPGAHRGIVGPKSAPDPHRARTPQGATQVTAEPDR